jgi:signal transduction histidine kinase
MAGSIGRQVERLSQLIGELLDVTRLQRGQFALETQPLDFAALVARVVDEMTLALSESDPHPAIRLLPPEAAVPVWGDPFRLEAVVQNLVSNAVKYSPDGGTVRVRVGSQGSEAILEVTDQGIGIPEEAQAHLFEPFYRAGNVGARTTGFGIGLYIVHEIVARHGGRITVSSTEGQGSTFRVTLPLRSPDA